METKPIRWAKFYSSNSPEFQTYYLEEKVLQNNGETHEFTSAEDAVARSTEEVFVFWNNFAISAGALKA